MSNSNSNPTDFGYRRILTDDGMGLTETPADVAQAHGAHVAHIGANVDTDGSKKAGLTAVRIGGAAGWCEGDRLARTSSDGMDEGRQLGGADVATGEGFGFPTCLDARKAMGISTLEYELRPSAARKPDGGWAPVPGQFHIAVADKPSIPDDIRNAIVSRSTVTERYGLAQPSHIDAVVDAVAKRFNVGIDRAVLWQGAKVYALQTRPLPQLLDTPTGPAKLRLMAQGGFDGQPVSFSLDARVMACRNWQMAIARAAGGRWTFRHVGDMEAKMEAFADLIAAESDAVVNAMFATAGALGTVKVTDAMLARSLARTFGSVKVEDGDGTKSLALSGQAKNKARSIIAHYTDADGAQPGTGWGALQAVTYEQSHKNYGDLATDYVLHNRAAGDLDTAFLNALLLENKLLTGTATQAEQDADTMGIHLQSVTLATFA